MSIFLLPQDQKAESALKGRIEKLAGVSVESLQRLGGGLNSRVFVAGTSDGSRILAKVYFSSSRDPRDRLGTEYRALTFLWNAGLRCVSRPVAVDYKQGLALYEFINGIPMNTVEADEQDIDDCLDFFQRLKLINGTPQAEEFGPASEACFSLKALIENIQGRCDRLLACKPDTPVGREMRAFLNKEFIPFFRKLTGRVRRESAPLGLRFDQEIAPEARTLSPSDFGFHNALCDEQGKTVFVDFEYFGWDDPVKTISDFCLHPAMTLTGTLKERFRNGMLKIFADVPALPQRVERVYPLYGLKWCMIFLNEFVRQDLERRRFAGPVPVADETRQREQLEKARAMLERSQTERIIIP